LNLPLQGFFIKVDLLGVILFNLRKQR